MLNSSMQSIHTGLVKAANTVARIMVADCKRRILASTSRQDSAKHLLAEVTHNTKLCIEQEQRKTQDLRYALRAAQRLINE